MKTKSTVTIDNAFIELGQMMLIDKDDIKPFIHWYLKNQLQNTKDNIVDDNIEVILEKTAKEVGVSLNELKRDIYEILKDTLNKEEF